jgi:hypothetical protein
MWKRNAGAGVFLTKKLWNDRNHPRAGQQKYAQHLRKIIASSFIQTVLSASESHRIMPCGSWALPPVGNCTLP